jgi:hypothetical protein
VVSIYLKNTHNLKWFAINFVWPEVTDVVEKTLLSCLYEITLSEDI